jgi:hypothetical protein
MNTEPTATKSKRSMYSAEQLTHWKRASKDSKMGSTVRGDAMVLKFISGKGTCLIGLEDWTP